MRSASVAERAADDEAEREGDEAALARQSQKAEQTVATRVKASSAIALKPPSAR